MGAISDDWLSVALFGRTQRAVLGCLFGQPDRSFYLREIVRAAGVGQGGVQRELRRLADAEILTETRIGNQVHYQANRDCPIFSELHGLMLKTAGLADVLREALAPLSSDIALAFVYGSQARGDVGAASDVDVFVVGDLDEMALHRALSTAEEKLGRDVNYTLLSRSEFARRRKEKTGFVERVLDGEKIALVGDLIHV